MKTHTKRVEILQKYKMNEEHQHVNSIKLHTRSHKYVNENTNAPFTCIYPNCFYSISLPSYLMSKFFHQ